MALNSYKNILTTIDIEKLLKTIKQKKKNEQNSKKNEIENDKKEEKENDKKEEIENNNNIENGQNKNETQQEEQTEEKGISGWFRRTFWKSDNKNQEKKKEKSEQEFIKSDQDVKTQLVRDKLNTKQAQGIKLRDMKARYKKQQEQLCQETEQ